MAVIANINHESSTNLTDATNYTAAVDDGGSLTISADSKQCGTNYGLKALTHLSGNAMYAGKTITQTKRVRVRFYLDISNFVMTSDNGYDGILTFYYATDGTYRARVIIKRTTGTTWQIGLSIANDAASTTTTYYTIAGMNAGSHCIEIDYFNATNSGDNNGYISGWYDGTQFGSVTGIDNDGKATTQLRFGFPSGPNSNDVGYISIDEIIANDDGGEIGQAFLVTDAITLGDAITDIDVVDNVEPDLNIAGATDAITPGETQIVTLVAPSDLGSVATDAITLGEANTQVSSNPTISVTDNQAIFDHAPLLKDNITLSESQSITVSDLNITISNGITVGESKNIMEEMLITVSDNQHVFDALPGLYDNVTVADSVSMYRWDNEINVVATDGATLEDYLDGYEDDIVVGEEVEMLVETSYILYIDITNNVAVGESTSRYVNPYFLSVSDDLTLGESSAIGALDVLPDLGIAITPDNVFAIGLRVYP